MLLLVLAVIVALPAFFAATFPVEETLATLLSLDTHFIFWSIALLGVTFAVNFVDSYSFNFKDVDDNVILLTSVSTSFCSSFEVELLTVILHDFDTPLDEIAYI